jgi:hypothetical protein
MMMSEAECEENGLWHFSKYQLQNVTKTVGNVSGCWINIRASLSIIVFTSM